jgi:hypothetical protein
LHRERQLHILGRLRCVPRLHGLIA